MTNHEHFVSIPKCASSLALTMRDLLGPYAAYFNRKYGLNGNGLRTPILFPILFLSGRWGRHQGRKCDPRACR